MKIGPWPMYCRNTGSMLRYGFHAFLKTCTLKRAKTAVLILPRFIQTSSKNSFANGVPGSEEPIPDKFKGSFDLGKIYERKPQKEPFVKNLFLGKFDRDILTYPEVLSKDDFDVMNDIVDPAENFMKTEVDSKNIDCEGKIPAETLQGLKDLGLYGLEIPVEYGGLGLVDTAYRRVAEAFAIDSSIALTLHMHQAVCVKGLLLNGTESQRRKYLPLLSSGEWTGAFCLSEVQSGSDAASIATNATLEEDGSGYRLNGTKVWVTNGGIANLMIVIARREVDDQDHDDICAFIVERSFDGVCSSQPEDKSGVRGANTTEVRFDNVFVPKENILGEKDEGYKVAMDILGSGRITVGSSCASILKHLMKEAVEHAVSRKQFGHTLSQFGMVKEKLARAAVDIYAMESMAYLTAGLADAYVDQDVSVETAIVKVFCSEKLTKNVSSLVQVLGTRGFSKDHPYERFLRDCRIFEHIEGTNNINRLFIGLVGLQFTGFHLNDDIKKMRNPFWHPKFTMNRVIGLLNASNRKLKLDLNLHEFLHPSLRESADELEKSTKKFGIAVQKFLGSQGQDVSLPEQQYCLARIADIAIELYAMTAVLGRASRSHCIGVHNSDHEMLMAKLFVIEAAGRVDTHVEGVIAPFNVIDEAISTVADSLFAKKGYAALHPLTRTFW